MPVTEHAEKRVRKRLGLKKKAVSRLTATAWEKGISHEEYTGTARIYLDRLLMKHKRSCQCAKVFNRHVFIFQEKVLITVFEMPKAVQRKLKKESE